MTLDEAIKHAEEVAEEQNKLFKRYDDASRHYRTRNEVCVSLFAKKALECFECVKEHRQLAEWLKDYKRLLEQESEWIPISEGSPKKDGKYLTTILNEYDNELRYVMTCYYFKGYWCPDNECASSNVIAWMPSPKPFDPQEPAGKQKVNCKSTKCENCINYNYCDYEPQEDEDI